MLTSFYCFGVLCSRTVQFRAVRNVFSFCCARACWPFSPFRRKDDDYNQLKTLSSFIADSSRETKDSLGVILLHASLISALCFAGSQDSNLEPPMRVLFTFTFFFASSRASFIWSSSFRIGTISSFQNKNSKKTTYEKKCTSSKDESRKSKKRVEMEKSNVTPLESRCRIFGRRSW